MTLIECFTQSHIDNLAACLRLRPDKVIFIGDAREMEKPVERYKKVLGSRGMSTALSLRDTREKDLKELCRLLRELLMEPTEWVIDLTGGSEVLIMAVGAVLAGMDAQKRQKIHVERLDRTGDAMVDCINGHCYLPGKPARLTVAELVAIHGGSLHVDSYQPPEDCPPAELNGLWEMVCEDPRDWNRQLQLLQEFESRSDSKMQVFLPLAHLRGSIRDFDEKESVVRQLLGKLERSGVIRDQSSRSCLEYTYRSQLLRYCLLKAGNMLEIKTLLEGRAAQEKGSPLFCDCQMGVSIDWDGVFYEPEERIPETRNEIDVVLMQGTTPLFISCKNGNIGEEELYKLHTVADRFGGPYARKMLIATHLDRKSPAANRAFVQRAWDMDIILVTDAAELSGEEWQQLFRNAMR